jgi:CRP/FNR family cyclic AMP-dependent transcriptional regulator
MDEHRLPTLPLFANLDRRERRLVASLADEVDVPAGKILTSEGEQSLEFFVIEEGTAEVRRQGELLAELGPGDFFGEVGVLEATPRNAGVTAVTPMRLVVLFAPHLRGLEAEIEEVSAILHQAIVQRGS